MMKAQNIRAVADKMPQQSTGPITGQAAAHSSFRVIVSMVSGFEVASEGVPIPSRPGLAALATDLGLTEALPMWRVLADAGQERVRLHGIFAGNGQGCRDPLGTGPVVARDTSVSFDH